MEGVIQKWGNSNVIRLPKSLLQSVNIRENDPVTLTAVGEDIIIKKLNRGFIHRTLEQRLDEAGVPFDYKIETTELGSSSFDDVAFCDEVL